jgi:phospholipase A1/A2
MIKKAYAVLATALLVLIGIHSAAFADETPDDGFSADPASFSSEVDSNQYALLSAPTTALDVGASTPPVPTTAASTQPEATSAAEGHFPASGATFGLEEFFSHFAPHEPMYFVGGTQAPNIKFQLSIRYRLFTPTGPLATRYPVFKGFNFGYTQTSFWDFSNASSPFFFDTSYKPEFFYYMEHAPYLKLPKDWQLGAQVGIEHESNGQRMPDHRSLNIAYFRPIFTVVGDYNLFFTLAPKFFGYIGDKSLNPDIANFRGYSELRLVVGQLDSLQLATIGRVGNHWNRGSAQFDLTYPLTKILHGNADVSLDAQWFYGYGDSLLTYNQRTSIFRMGLAVVR